MTIYELGYNDNIDKYRNSNNLDSFEIGRVISEHKERYIVKNEKCEFDSELIGNMRFTAESRYDLPAVGDWVAFAEYDDGKALIHAVYPRVSVIERQASGKSGSIQIIATNIDYGLIVQAVDNNFNLNRIERYLTICNASKVKPIIILSKIDLISKAQLKLFFTQIINRINDVPVISVSNQTVGYDELSKIISSGKTYCLLGSSGVGKSTLLNALSGKPLMKTGNISESIKKGRHITSHRELFVLNNGGILIDNPGMREVGISDSSNGLEITFESILEYSMNCKFSNCTHTNEKGCAIIEAVEIGEIDKDSYANFRKMEKEKAFFESSAIERKKKDKQLGKLIKSVTNQWKKDRF